MKYDTIDNNQMVNIYKDISQQLLAMSKPLGNIILQYSRLRNEFSIVSNEVNNRIINKSINIDDYGDEIKEVFEAINSTFEQLKETFPISTGSNIE